MKTNILESLEVITYTPHQREIGLPAHVRECVAAEYGALTPVDQNAKFRATSNSKTVNFGQVETTKWKSDLSPALQLLAICTQLSAIATAPHNKGLILRVSSQDLPYTKPKGAGEEWVTVSEWMQSRESVAQRKHDAALAKIAPAFDAANK